MKVIKKKKDDETEINYNITCKKFAQGITQRNPNNESGFLHMKIQIVETDFLA